MFKTPEEKSEAKQKTVSGYKKQIGCWIVCGFTGQTLHRWKVHQGNFGNFAEILVSDLPNKTNRCEWCSAPSCSCMIL